MKIQINTEAELDIDALAEALDSTIESKVDAFVDSAIDSAIEDYNFYDIVRDQINDIDLSYEVDSVLEGRDDLIGNDEMVEVESRITDLEETIARLSQALPNTELAKSITANEELQTKYNELEAKFKKMAGLDEVSDYEKDQI